MVLSGYPLGQVQETHIQRVALAMLQFGMLGKQYATEVRQRWSNRWSVPAPEPTRPALITSSGKFSPYRLPPQPMHYHLSASPQVATR